MYVVEEQNPLAFHLAQLNFKNIVLLNVIAFLIKITLLGYQNPSQTFLILTKEGSKIKSVQPQILYKGSGEVF